MKICIITHKKFYAKNKKLYSFGGYFSIIRHFIENPIDLTIIGTGNSNKIQRHKFYTPNNKELEIYTVKNTEHFIRKLLWQISLGIQLVKLYQIKRYNALIIQIPSLFKLPIPAFLARFFKIPLIISIHGNWEFKPAKRSFFNNLLNSINLIVLKISLKLCSGVITSNSEIGKRILSQGFIKPLKIIPYGADLLQFNSSVEKITTFHPFILYVGQISKAKGVNLLLHAFLKIKNQHLELNLVLIGKLHEHILNVSQIKSEIGKRIHYLGYLSQKKVSKFMKSAEILILPSLSEGSPKVICEALACGTPVIGSRIAGIEEIIKDGFNGLLVTPNNIDELAKAIDTLLLNKELIQQFSKNAITIINENFNMELNIKKYIDFCLKLKDLQPKFGK